MKLQSARTLRDFSLRLAIGLLFSQAGLAQDEQSFELKNGDRVLFIGDTFFEREVDYGHIETRLTAAFPDRNVSYRNLGWAADTPMGRARASFDWNKSEDDWLKRVKEQVTLVKPTVAFLSYGMTAALEAADETTKEQRQAKIEKFEADMNKLMNAIEEVSGQKVRFVLLGPTPHGDHDGCSADCLNRHAVVLKLCEQAIAKLAEVRKCYFQQLLDWPPDSFDARGKRSTVDGIHLTQDSYAFIAAFIEQGLLHHERIGAGKQYELLRSAIRKKNELFFHRWRPENWTYLLGFRKQEQGQNAAELPQFEPLIAQWEARIAKLRDLKHQDPATVKEVTELLRKEKQPEKAMKPLPTPTFDIADGFEVNLWAEDPLLHKPIEINWDAQGRLWVASSEVYPQIKPGQPATDRVIVLEDTNGDGKADKSAVFADGLLIPTGVLPDSNGGCYVAASHELLYFKDTNGDGKADEKRIVLSSFGTEDTHHNLHTLRWGYDGHIYMNQSIYTHTHIETPLGVRRLNSAGIWRFDPYTYQLEVFTRGGCNPWGHTWDDYGNSFFTDGAGFQGVSYCVPGAMYFTYAGARRELQSISPGNYPKFASLEVVRSPQFPDDWQGDFITCDFRAHRVVHFKYSEAGAGYQTKEMPDLLRSTNVTFRPIDVKFGPDGALYIADWSNPIIQHGEVDFRDPRRDKEHGRIWRVTAKGRPVAKKENLAKLGLDELFDRTLSKNAWEQASARRVLAEKLRQMRPARVSETVGKWSERRTTDRAKLESAWLYEAVGTFDDGLLLQLLGSKDFNIRVAATRILEYAPGHSKNAEEQLANMISDEHPRVRLEALRVLAKIPSPKSAELALSVLGKPMDPFLDYALWLTINDLADPWIAAIKSGEWKVEGREKQLEFGLKAIEPEKASAVLGQLLGEQPLARDGRGPWIDLIGRAGSPKELQRLFDQIARRGFDKPTAARALAVLNEAARLRNARPPSGHEKLREMFSAPLEIRVEALRLVGQWNVRQFVPDVLKAAGDPAAPGAIREAAFESLRSLSLNKDPAIFAALRPLAGTNNEPDIRRQAAVILAGIDLGKALPDVVQILMAAPNEMEAESLWRGLLSLKESGAKQSVGAYLAEWGLPKSGVPEIVARAGLRVAREGGRNEPELVLALTRGANLEAAEASLTDAEIQQIAASAAVQGDPARGEKVFRRPELGCVTCHAIGGVGGRVGPDLTSIGASAPADYLVESVFYPSRKIKEGYHAVVLETQDGQELSGILVRENNEQVVIRDVSNREVAIPKNNIKSRTMGGSLMPSGLIDNLPARDRVDLFRFLSELGKPGPYDASKGGVARFWKVRAATHEVEQFGLERVAGGDLNGAEWQAVYSLVDGRLTREAVEGAMRQNKYAGLVGIFLGAKFQVSGAGETRFKLSDATDAAIWIDGKPTGARSDFSAQLAPGTHTVILRFEPTKLPENLRLESPDATFLAN